MRGIRGIWRFVGVQGASARFVLPLGIMVGAGRKAVKRVVSLQLRVESRRSCAFWPCGYAMAKAIIDSNEHARIARGFPSILRGAWAPARARSAAGAAGRPDAAVHERGDGAVQAVLRGAIEAAAPTSRLGAEVLPNDGH